MDEEHPLPTGERHDQSANSGPETKPDARDDAPGNESLAAFTPILKLMGQHGHAAGEHRSTREPLQKAGNDQNWSARCEAAQQRGKAEGHGGDDHNPFAAETVGQRPRRHQHRGAGNGVGIHDPLQILEIGGEHAFQFRKDHRYAGDFETEQQRGKAGPHKRNGVSLNLKPHIDHFLSELQAMLFKLPSMR
ncbi:hypothetical protein C8D77_103459 [Mesorhizobium loti]|uniref:Uncharacterized protein n=1 Tax=Rhizobium loti TaxID=381 RepID=A0A8E2WGH5_RHILI|nr:hypothetical protein C8D77_103459 [Mesorhizobium loti]